MLAVGGKFLKFNNKMLNFEQFWGLGNRWCYLTIDIDNIVGSHRSITLHNRVLLRFLQKYHTVRPKKNNPFGFSWISQRRFKKVCWAFDWNKILCAGIVCKKNGVKRLKSRQVIHIFAFYRNKLPHRSHGAPLTRFRQHQIFFQSAIR